MTAPRSGPPTPSRRRRWPYLAAVVALAGLAVGGVVGVGVLRDRQRDDRYRALLEERGVADQFPNAASAQANARRVCAELERGGAAEGYQRDAVAVEVYCGEFLDAFRVLPTPEEQRAAYLDALDDGGLAGLFSSDEQAVAHAGRVCDALAAGGNQQGLPQDRVAVQVYCGEFLDGFKVLRTETVEGSITLYDSDPNTYIPAIISYGTACMGGGGYGDIGPGTTVTVRNDAGALLAQTSLGVGTGSDYQCQFPFSFEVTEGEDAYVIDISDRGEMSYSFTELINGGAQLSLGS